MSFLYEQDQDSFVTWVSTYLSDFRLHGLKKPPASSKPETHEKANGQNCMCAQCTSCSMIDAHTMSHPHICYHYSFGHTWAAEARRFVCEGPSQEGPRQVGPCQEGPRQKGPHQHQEGECSPCQQLCFLAVESYQWLPARRCP